MSERARNDAPNEPRDGTASAAPEPGTEPAPDAEAGPAEQSAAADPQTLQAGLEQARREAEEYRERFLRAKAEAENVRRRAEAELANAARYGVEPLARELLGVRDSLGLAGSVDFQRDDAAAVEKMVEGLRLTLKLLDAAFDRTGVSLVDPQPGEKFDPALHQAMGTRESGDMAPNHVVQVVQRGYRLHDRLLRPAMVMVSKAPAGNGEAKG